MYMQQKISCSTEQCQRCVYARTKTKLPFRTIVGDSGSVTFLERNAEAEVYSQSPIQRKIGKSSIARLAANDSVLDASNNASMPPTPDRGLNANALTSVLFHPLPGGALSINELYRKAPPDLQDQPSPMSNLC